MKLTEAIREYHSSLMEMWDHQKDELRIWEDKTNRGLFWEMGSGKTFTAILMAFQKFIRLKKIVPTLIICPKLVMENWKREAGQRLPPEIAKKIILLDGTQTDRIRKLRLFKEGHIFVLNIEGLDMAELLKWLMLKDFEMLIVDESHRFKDPRGSRFKKLVKLADVCTYKTLLTGTPILNDEIDIWPQFRLMGKHIAGENFFTWRLQNFYNKNANNPFVSFPKWEIKPDSVGKIQRLINEHCSVKTKAEVMKHLPPLVRKEMYVELSPAIAKAYKEMEKHFVTEVDDKIISADIVLVKMLRLQQLACGIIKDDEGNISSVKTQKHEALKLLLEDLCPHQKVIVWANFKACIKDIQKVCEDLELHYCVIEGGQTNTERQEQIDNFNKVEKYSVCIANQAAGGIGIGLQAASYMIYFSKDYRLEMDLQSEARAHRGGSEIHQCITRIDLLTKGTIEEDIHSALREKGKLGDIVRGAKSRWK